MNYLLSKKSLTFFISGLLCLVLAGCDDRPTTPQVESSTLQAIRDRGTIRIGVFSDKPPFGYMDKDGNNQGYDIDLAKRIAQDLLGDENKVEFVLTEAQNRINILTSNKVDITLANFTVTPERAEQVDFANPYMKTAIGIVSPKSNPITELSQLEGAVVIVNKGTTAENYLAKNYPNIRLQRYDHNTEAFAALRDGRGFGLAHDNTLLYAWTKENPDFEVTLHKIGDDDVIAPAVKKNNTELLAWLNEEITTLQQQKFFHQSYEKSVKPFYGDDIDPNNIVIDTN